MLRRRTLDECADTVTDLALPPGTRLLHLGPQKTGTTSLQAVMHRIRAELRRHGVVYPGKGTRPREGVWAALGLEVPGVPGPHQIAGWHHLVEEVRQAGDLRVCVSTEDFAKADDAGAAKVVRELGDGRAHVVAAARRLDRLLPSQWQQRVKMRATTLDYETWLERVLGTDRSDPARQNLWIPHDVGNLAERWVRALDGDAERFTLVVADESDPGLLLRTFERMLALPFGMLSAVAEQTRNASLGIGRIEAIRRLSIAFEDNDWPREVTPLTSRVRVRVTNALKADAPWPGEAGLPALPGWAADRVAELSEQRAATVASLGVRVVGHPDHLRTPELSPTGSDSTGPIMVSAELAARVAEVAIDATLAHTDDVRARQDRQVQRLRRRVTRLRGRSQPDLSAVSGRQLLRELVNRLRKRLLG